MANKIKLRRSYTPGVSPSLAELEANEVAINYADGKLFVRTPSNTIQSITLGSGGSAPSSTDALTEGTTNLYFTNARASAAAPIQSVAGRTGAVTLAVADITNAVATSDARLSDSREWAASTVSQADAEAGTSTTRVAFTPLRVFQAIAAWWAASAAKTKLDGIATGATANQTDAHLLARANHTGTQTAATISDFSTAAASAAPVQSVAGRTGTVTLAVGDVSNAVANAGSVSAIRRLTQAQYDAISSPDATTLYVIVE
jgi:hypothetical protein